MKIDKYVLETALINVVAPAKDFHTTCPNCGHEHHANNGEWLLWCGDKKHAEAILEAAKVYLKPAPILEDEQLLKFALDSCKKIDPDYNFDAAWVELEGKPLVSFAREVIKAHEAAKQEKEPTQ